MRNFCALFASCLVWILPAVPDARAAEEAKPVPKPSICLAMAAKPGAIVPVVYRPTALDPGQVSVRYIGHSTFLITSAAGVRIATDFTGYAGRGVVPDVVTMNHAHETHYTDEPDPAIKHVLRGWTTKAGIAAYDITIKDVRVRNVVTNIRTWDGKTELYGNSIFIFEVAGLCIGHLGHLHHDLTSAHLAQIGRLDVVMIAVDGSFTLDHDGVESVLRKLRPRVVLPMHAFGEDTMNAFLARLKESYGVRRMTDREIILSRAALPRRAEVIVLPGY